MYFTLKLHKIKMHGEMTQIELIDDTLNQLKFHAYFILLVFTSYNKFRVFIPFKI